MVAPPEAPGKLTSAELEYIYHHVFLPKAPPQSLDYNDDHENALLEFITRSIREYEELSEVDSSGVQAAIAMLECKQKLSAADDEEAALEAYFLNMDVTTPALPLHIKAQNACMLIRPTTSGSVKFSSFELSPTNSAVMGTQGRLLRSFPGATVEMAQTVVKQQGFASAAAAALSTLAYHVVFGMQPTARKAGQDHIEDRDTTHPAMISEVFMGFASSLGETVAAPEIIKRTRDEVTIKTGSRSPWRRSPRWLLLRVALQLALGDELYKRVMLFTLARILQAATAALPRNKVMSQDALSRTMLRDMISKVSHRLHKLGRNAGRAAAHSADDAMAGATRNLEAAWSLITAGDARQIDLNALAHLDFERDANVQLKYLDEFLASVNKRTSNASRKKWAPLSGLRDQKLSGVPAPLSRDSLDGEYVAANLLRTEQWIAEDCQQWAQDHPNIDDVPRRLTAVMQAYHAHALRHYSGNPEAMSVMTLCVLELWVEIDRAEIKLIPLMLDYEPGFDCEVLQNLQLCSGTDMSRLLAIENYIDNRRRSARSSWTLICKDTESDRSLPVRYFSQSPDMQALRKAIEAAAQRERIAKLQELQQKQEEYDRSMATFHNTDHEKFRKTVKVGRNEFQEMVHWWKKCAKCKARQHAESLTIRIHEWPLPHGDNAAKTVVFELRVPQHFAAWRDASAFLVQSVLKSSPGDDYALSRDPHLSMYIATHSENRLHLLSAVKPNVATHRKDVKLSEATEGLVCVRNGFKYGYYDNVIATFVDSSDRTDFIPRACTYKLPPRSRDLEKYLFRPARSPNGPSHNVVIANQSSCPEHMTLDEYVKICGLPLGCRLQWPNILVELQAPSIDFKKEETGLSLMQCIYQAGPSNDTVVRLNHGLLEDPLYGRSMLRALHAAFDRVKENWESSQALHIISVIALKLLSSTPSPDIEVACLSLLETLRNTSFEWVENLRTKAHHSTLDRDRKEFTARCIDVALVCALTADVHNERLLDQVFGQHDVVSKFVQCGILIQEGRAAYSSSGQPLMAILKHRFDRLLYRSSRRVQDNAVGLAAGIHGAWSSFRSTAGWSVEAQHWLHTQAIIEGHSDILDVHYDLLSGKLLVNGQPLDRPPAMYEALPIWSTLFRDSAVEVMPTTVPGMQFSVKRLHRGHQIHFGLQEADGTKDLILRASRGPKVYELIPSRLLRGKFPEAFVNEYVHWYSFSDQHVEFRYKDNPWSEITSTIGVWTLRQTLQWSWNLMKDFHSVVRVDSPTAKVIFGILEPLAERQSIHCLYNSKTADLGVELPSIQLGFAAHRGRTMLTSREFRGMYVDGNQSLGTLIGLRSKLVLTHRTSGEQAVLIPEGEVIYEATSGHVAVSVANRTVKKVHKLSVDRQLDRLLDAGDLQCKLFIAYLHALTSYCLPDSLTKSTGTEQALHILGSAAVRSFATLSEANTALLLRMARLSPGRSFYPKNLQDMQTVVWDQHLSAASQDDGFIPAVDALFRQAQGMMTMFPEHEWTIPDLIRTDTRLLSRSMVRYAANHVSGHGAETVTDVYDVQYQARDRGQNSPSGSLAHIMSTIAGSPIGKRHYAAPTAKVLWSLIAELDSVSGPDSVLEGHPLNNVVRVANSGLDLATLLPVLKVLTKDDADGRRTTDAQFMLWLSYLGTRADVDTVLLHTFALARNTDIGNRALPDIEQCSPREGHQVRKAQIQNLIGAYVTPLESSPEGDLLAEEDEDAETFQARQRTLFETNRGSVVAVLRDGFYAQRQSSSPVLPDLAGLDVLPDDYVALYEVLAAVQERFRLWHNNLKLFQYFQSIEGAAAAVPVSQVYDKTWPISAPTAPTRRPGYVHVQTLFDGPAPLLPQPAYSLPTLQAHNIPDSAQPRLAQLVDRLKSFNISEYEQRYATELEKSMTALRKQLEQDVPRVDATITPTILKAYAQECMNHAKDLYRRLVHSINSRPLFSAKYQLPRLSPSLFLQLLAGGEAWSRLDHRWQLAIVQFTRAITETRRGKRMCEVAVNPDELIRELENQPYSNWDPLEHPEWLLLEVEGSITIRKVQVDIAKEMMNPPAGQTQNAVMQLNMGEGKSSCIVPMCAATLGNSTQLVRVLVAKPQSKQMEEMLSSRLGGLLNRRLYFMPFSRALKFDQAATHAIHRIMQQCMESRGVLLMQPEHILSFELMGLEASAIGKSDVGASLVAAQDFFDNNARDIIDESDEILSPKFEVIYTMGAQRSIELATARWGCIQQVLDLTRGVAQTISQQPQYLELNAGPPGSFPRLRVLEKEAEAELVAGVAGLVCQQGLDGFPIARRPIHVREAVQAYITEPDLTLEQIAAVEQNSDDGIFTDAMKPVLYLLRGLLAGGVIGFVFRQKRWRVNFGLATSRTPPTKLGVPYTSKDQPSLRSEFSHPDVVIVLTSLCYYYGGLDYADLMQALSHMMDSDQANAEYSCWIADAPTMPSAFRQLEGLNLRDRQQCETVLWPHLRHSKAVIDYYLAQVVFPKEMKEFEKKISASGWNLAKIKAHPTTGFSGTNDSSTVLPLDIHQLDLPAQQHTNALVLERLLGDDNDVILLPRRSEAFQSDADQLLSTVLRQKDPPVRVILDAGAQILELNNEEVAKRWLSLETDEKIKAAVYLDEDHQISVVDRRGRIEALRTSPFFGQLDVCQVFLDEAHTRGIDLKLPTMARAAVTLGPGISKDKLVQACMRMRKLGKGQTVMFCLNDEIAHKVRMSSQKPEGQKLTVSDILLWSMRETFDITRRAMPLWVVQGHRFVLQQQLWDAARTDRITTMSKEHAEKFLDDEAQRLKDRYRPRTDKNDIHQVMPKITGRLVDIEQRCREFDSLQYLASALQEEQERELAPEMEQERQVERPGVAQPAEARLHADVKKFFLSGQLPGKSEAFMPAFNALLKTSVAADMRTSAFPIDDASVLATADFASTIRQNPGTARLDAYQRPVQWIVSIRKGKHVQQLVIISPHEAQYFMNTPGIASDLTLHVYKARCNSAHPAFDTLNDFTYPHRPQALVVPLKLVDRLNIFAGQLYFTTFANYKRICALLGLATVPAKGLEVHDADGFIRKNIRGRLTRGQSPVKFLQTLVSTIRKNGQSVSKTTMGMALEGKLLTAKDVEKA